VDKQVITHTVPPIEQAAADPGIAAQLAVASNNAVLDMANEYPDRLIPIGTVAMNDVEAACREAERCLTQLGMKGILISSHAHRPLPAGAFRGAILRVHKRASRTDLDPSLLQPEPARSRSESPGTERRPGVRLAARHRDRDDLPDLRWRPGPLPEPDVHHP